MSPLNYTFFVAIDTVYSDTPIVKKVLRSWRGAAQPLSLGKALNLKAQETVKTALPSRPDTVLLRPTGYNTITILLRTIKYLDPRASPNKWLKFTLLDLLKQDTEESKKALEWALPAMASWLEAGLIDQLFAEWIEQYVHLLEKPENNQNNENQLCLHMDSQE